MEQGQLRALGGGQLQGKYPRHAVSVSFLFPCVYYMKGESVINERNWLAV